MCLKKNNPKPQDTEESKEMKPISEEELEGISGAGNPWDNVEGVPTNPIDKKIRENSLY